MIVKKIIIPLLILIAASISHTVAMHEIKFIDPDDIQIVPGSEYFEIHGTKCSAYTRSILCNLSGDSLYKIYGSHRKSCESLYILSHDDGKIIASYHDKYGIILAAVDVTKISREERVKSLKAGLDPSTRKTAVVARIEGSELCFYDKYENRIFDVTWLGLDEPESKDLKKFEEFIKIDNSIKITRRGCFESCCICMAQAIC